MKQTVRLGRVAGIPIGMHWSALVILVLLTEILAWSALPGLVTGLPAAAYWVVALPAVLLFLGSLLAHELAHAVVARRDGLRVRAITLWLFGGVAELDGEPPSPAADLRIAAAGPITSLAAALAFGGAATAASALGGPELGTAALAWLGVTNAALAVFNLLPGAPLDGGRVLRAVLWRRGGDRARAAKTAAQAGQLLGGTLAGLGVLEVLAWGRADGLWLALIGWFLTFAAGAEERSSSVHQAVAAMPVHDVMTPDPACGPAWTRVDEFAARTALHSRQTVFPVVDIDGSPIGVVNLDMLARIPPRIRSATRLGQVALPVPPGYLTGPDDPVAPLFDRPALASELAAVVLTDGKIVGLVSAHDLVRAVRQGRLRRTASTQPPG
jgi:Zn-dependent protease